MLMQKFGVVQAPRTSSNLLEPQQHRENKVWRGLSPAFGVVRLYRTFSFYSIAGETRCAGCFCTSSGWFKHIEPHRTYSNHNSTKIARCGEVCHLSSGWFKHSEPPRTYANHNITELARCGEVCHRSSGWFDCTERSLATSLQGKQGVQGVSSLVRGGSSTANLIEPTRTTSSQS